MKLLTNAGVQPCYYKTAIMKVLWLLYYLKYSPGCIDITLAGYHTQNHIANDRH